MAGAAKDVATSISSKSVREVLHTFFNSPVGKLVRYHLFFSSVILTAPDNLDAKFYEGSDRCWNHDHYVEVGNDVSYSSSANG